MYGVPSDLPLARFVGHECNQVALGQFQIQFHFVDAGSVYVESGWELRSANGDLIDAACEHTQRDCYRIHKIIGVPVVSFAIDPPVSFTLFFASGHALIVFDDSDQYESFSVHVEGGGDIYI
jgi:hypothetical protein